MTQRSDGGPACSQGAEMKCLYCKEPGDLRPYGPRGAMICFDCMKASPDREAAARCQFLEQIDACGHVAVIDGSHVGPYPYRKVRT